MPKNLQIQLKIRANKFSIMDEALKHVNEVVFSNSLQESQRFYTEWSKSYDKDVDALLCTYAVEAAKMLEKHAMNSKTLLDVGSGKDQSKIYSR